MTSYKNVILKDAITGERLLPLASQSSSGTTEVPLCFGFWYSKNAGVSSDYIEVHSGELYSKADYPDLYDYLTKVLSGELPDEGLLVATIDKEQEILNTPTKEWERIHASRKVLEYFFVDVENEQFKCPLTLPSNRILGDSNGLAYEESANSVTKKIFADGRIIIDCPLCQLDKVVETKTNESGETTKHTYYTAKTTYKQTNEDGTEDFIQIPSEVQSIDLFDDPDHLVTLRATTKPLTITFDTSMLNAYYIVNISYCTNTGELLEDGTEHWASVGDYGYAVLDRSITSCDITLPLYDSNVDNCVNDDLLKTIALDETRGVLAVVIVGFISPLTTQEYNTPNRFYIKAKK